MGKFTTFNNTIDPLEAWAIRAATGIALSAQVDPSRGTKIRLNIVCLLSMMIVFSIAAMIAACRRSRHHHGYPDLREEYTPLHSSNTPKRCSHIFAYLAYSTREISPPISSPVCPGFMTWERIWQ